MIGYKGFDKNFKCRGFQYEVGQTYKFDGELEICKCGFHFCDTPLAVFEFYSPADSRFALVEAVGNVVKGDENKHKFCTDELKIIKELTLDELIAAVPTKNAATNTGNCSAATNTGDRSTATNTGDFSVATNTGNCSAATNTGKYSATTNTGDLSAATNTGNCSAANVSGKSSVALVTGRDSKAKGAIGCWLVLGEWNDNELADVQVFKVDGVNIKADTYYKLKDGHAVEAEEES